MASSVRPTAVLRSALSASRTRATGAETCQHTQPRRPMTCMVDGTEAGGLIDDGGDAHEGQQDPAPALQAQTFTQPEARDQGAENRCRGIQQRVHAGRYQHVEAVPPEARGGDLTRNMHRGACATAGGWRRLGCSAWRCVCRTCCWGRRINTCRSTDASSVRPDSTVGHVLPHGRGVHATVGVRQIPAVIHATPLDRTRFANTL